MSVVSNAGLLALASELIAEGFVDELDRDDLVRAIASWAESCGLIGVSQRERLRGLADERRQRAIVDEYVRLAKETRSVKKRSAKIAALGVNSSTLSHWAQRHYGRRYLQQFGPPAALWLVIGYLERNPGATRKQIRAHAGVATTSLPGALNWGFEKGYLRRVKPERGLIQWWCTDAARKAMARDLSPISQAARSRRKAACARAAL